MWCAQPDICKSDYKYAVFAHDKKQQFHHPIIHYSECKNSTPTREMCSRIFTQTHSALTQRLMSYKLTFWPQEQCLHTACYGLSQPTLLLIAWAVFSSEYRQPDKISQRQLENPYHGYWNKMLYTSDCNCNLVILILYPDKVGDGQILEICIYKSSTNILF